MERSMSPRARGPAKQPHPCVRLDFVRTRRRCLVDFDTRTRARNPGSPRDSISPSTVELPVGIGAIGWGGEQVNPPAEILTKINFARFILAKGGDSEAPIREVRARPDAGGGFGQRPGPAAVVAEEIEAGILRCVSAAIDVSPNDSAAELKMIGIIIDRVDERPIASGAVIDAGGGDEALAATPAVIASQFEDVDLFACVLANVADEQRAGQPIERAAPRIAQAQGL